MVSHHLLIWKFVNSDLSREGVAKEGAQCSLLKHLNGQQTLCFSKYDYSQKKYETGSDPTSKKKNNSISPAHKKQPRCGISHGTADNTAFRKQHPMHTILFQDSLRKNGDSCTKKWCMFSSSEEEASAQDSCWILDHHQQQFHKAEGYWAKAAHTQDQACYIHGAKNKQAFSHFEENPWVKITLGLDFF